MKHLIATLFISAALVVSAADEAVIASTNDTAVSVNETIVTANATLKDGSTVKGEFLAPKITGSTAFSNQLALDPAIVKSLTFTSTNGEAKVTLVNGDAFAMSVSDTGFKIKSLLGDLGIPRANFRALSFSVRRGGNAADGGLVFYCTFDDEAATKTPAIGPAVKIELGQIIIHEGKKNGSLFVKPGIAGAEVVFPTGTFTSEGCIEFWANMASGKTEFSTGGDPRFIVLLDENGNEKSHFEFASNDGCGNSGLSGHFFGIRTQTHTGFNYTMPYSDIFKGADYNGWHHYALVWTPTSLSIYLDGKKVCSSAGRLNTEEITRGQIVMDIPLNRNTGKSYNNKSAFLIDELKIWNIAKTGFDL